MLNKNFGTELAQQLRQGLPHLQRLGAQLGALARGDEEVVALLRRLGDLARSTGASMRAIELQHVADPGSC